MNGAHNADAAQPSLRVLSVDNSPEDALLVVQELGQSQFQVSGRISSATAIGSRSHPRFVERLTLFVQPLVKRLEVLTEPLYPSSLFKTQRAHHR